MQSLASGDPASKPSLDPRFIIERDGRSYALYAGILDLAHQQGLKSIITTLIQIPNDGNAMVCICQAVVETDKGSFSGIADASPANVTAPMRNAIIRMAETRAKARALRDATNVGMAALEELGDGDEAQAPVQRPQERRAAAPKGAQQNTPPERRAQDDRITLAAEYRKRPVAEMEKWAADRIGARSWQAMTTANREKMLALLEKGDAIDAGVAS